jgi:nicotinamidase-related amidase
MKQGLLVIDVQNDYFAGGKMPLVGVDAALSNVNRLEEKFRKAKLPIIYIQHIKCCKNADFFEKGTLGAALHPQLKIDDQSIIIQKHFPNSFWMTTLEKKLCELGIEQLIICGMMTHMCVQATTPVAAQKGYKPILIHDATATRDLVINGKLKLASQVQSEVLANLSKVSEIKSVKEI